MPAFVLALNPSIDAEWRVNDVLWEEKNDVRTERRWAGGKGINVARWFKHLGGRPHLLVPLGPWNNSACSRASGPRPYSTGRGGKTGAELAGYLHEERIPAEVIRLREATRVNIIVTTDAGRQMRFNAPGPKLSRREWGEVLNRVKRILGSRRREEAEELHTPDVRLLTSSATRGVGLLILSGSLPRGLPVTAYAQLIRLAHRCGVRALLDCDGPAFAAAVKARPFLVKPNEHELAQWRGKPLNSEAEIVRAARALSEQTRGWVLVSRGAKRGLLVNQAVGFQRFAAPPRVKPRNTVGAGDALLAAVARAIQRGASPAQWLAAGLKIGSAATQRLAGQLR